MVLTLLASDRADAQAINVGTQGNASNWLVTGAGASQSPAFPYGGLQQEISITDNGDQFGNFGAGGSLANFDGFWYADRSFVLPADATGVSLAFSGLEADDRAVLMLNGTIIGNIDSYNGPGLRQFTFLPGPPDQPYTFTNVTSGIVTSGFMVGGTNTLRLIVNNTSGTTTSTFTGLGDGTHGGVEGTVSFASVPEPSSLLLLSLGTASAIESLRRRHRK